LELEDSLIVCFKVTVKVRHCESTTLQYLRQTIQDCRTFQK